MADGRDTDIWTRHAEEQAVDNPQVHNFNDDYVLMEWLHSLDVKKVVDVGCGGGLWRDLFKGYDYLGIDQNENMIRHAIGRGTSDTLNFQVVPWHKYPFEESTFDLAFCSAVLQHNRHKDKEKVVQEIVRIVKPGGYFMCTENTFRKDNFRHTFPHAFFLMPDMTDGYSFTQDGWRKFMEPLGLKMIRFKNPSEYLYQVIK